MCIKVQVGALSAAEETKVRVVTLRLRATTGALAGATGSTRPAFIRATAAVVRISKNIDRSVTAFGQV
jgi:hypothetical protein